MASTTSSKSSKTERPSSAARPELPQWIEVGRVERPHGVRGEVSVAVLSDNAERFAPGAVVWGAERALEIASRRTHKGGLLITFVGIDDRDAAAELRGLPLVVPREQVPPAPPGEYYYYELEGCRVIDEGEGELGVVTRVHEDGGGLLLEVRMPAAKIGQQPDAAGDDAQSAARRTLLIPFVQRHLLEVDVAAGVIRTRLPEGLVELCASTS